MKEVVIKLTDKCPCKCTFCESGNGKFANHLEISDDNIMSFAEQLVRENLKICVISGGEPLLRNELADKLINYLHSFGVYVVLNTSGVLFIRKRLRDYLCSQPDLIVFSLDSCIEEKHDSHRGVLGLYSAIRNTIEDIHQISNSGLSVGIRFVMTKLNYNELDCMISLCSEWNVDCLKITNIENDYLGVYSLTANQCDDLFNRVIPNSINVLKRVAFENEALRLDGIKKMSSFMSGMSASDMNSNLFFKNIAYNTECPLRSEFVLVGGDGNIYPCCESEHHHYPILGNEGITDIETVKKKLKDLRFNRLEFCKRCTLQRNIQINFTSNCLKVNDRCKQ
jgi:MoaA/NifB/PqqE/SkfB family radical SAM enzyme